MVYEDILKEVEKRYKEGELKKKKDAVKDKLVSSDVILYGVGFFGSVIEKNFRENGIEVKCFCDSKKKGTDKETGLQIISPDELAKDNINANVVISVANPSTEQAIYNAVVSLGFETSKIFRFSDAYLFMDKSRVERLSITYNEFMDLKEGYRKVFELLKDDKSKTIIGGIINSYLFHDLFEYENPSEKYFPKQFDLSESEMFIDGGMCTGSTSLEFIEKTNTKYAGIIGFDIDTNNLSVAKENLIDCEKVNIVSKGLWKKKELLHAETGIVAGSHIRTDALDLVEVISLDEYYSLHPEVKKPTYIKLHLEGSEKEALIGAQDIIKTYKPKLAICVYHSPKDIIDIAELVMKLNSDYKLFLGKYSPYMWDTVLYAY